MTMPPALRRFALTVHLIVSVGWIGALAAYLALDLAVTTSQSHGTLRAGYLAMELITLQVIVPLAVASLLTGLVMALGTKWGLFRHYWVIISLLLTVFAVLVLLSEARVVSALAAVAGDPGTSPDDLRALPGTLVHSMGGLVVLFVVTVLNIYKPRGMTRYGQRRLREQRRAPTRTEDSDPPVHVS
ncbi:MAG TPA: hypothetical protein VHF25_12255 [Nitriliruptorales bacterium]|nr:hypothetical protein [Nitriliruptorales bacterium]